MLYIIISSFSYSGNVEHHNHPILGPSVLTGNPYGLVHVPPILGLVLALISYVTPHSKWYDIVHFGSQPAQFCYWVLP